MTMMILTFLKYATDPDKPSHSGLFLIQQNAIKPSVSVSPLQIYRGRLPAQKVLPHSIPDEDAPDARLFQDAHLYFLRVPAHPPRPGPHPVPRGGQLPHAASTTDSPQLRSDHSLSSCLKTISTYFNLFYHLFLFLNHFYSIISIFFVCLFTFSPFFFIVC